MTDDRRWDGGDASRIEALEAELQDERRLHEATRAEVRRLAHVNQAANMVERLLRHIHIAEHRAVVRFEDCRMCAQLRDES